MAVAGRFMAHPDLSKNHPPSAVLSSSIRPSVRMACPHFGTCTTHPDTTRHAQDEHHPTKTICFHKLEVGTVFYTHTTSRSGLSKRHLTISVYSSVIYHAFYEECCARLGRRDEKRALLACQLDGLGDETPGFVFWSSHRRRTEKAAQNRGRDHVSGLDG